MRSASMPPSFLKMQAGVCGVRRVRTLKDTKLLLLDLYSLVEFAGGVPEQICFFFFLIRTSRPVRVLVRTII